MNGLVLENSRETPQASSNRCTSTVICHCLAVTDVEVETAVVTCQLQTVKDIGRCTGAGQGCMACHIRLKAVLERVQCS